MNRVSTAITAFCFSLSVAVCFAQIDDFEIKLIVSGKDNYWKTGGTVTEGTNNPSITVTDQQNQEWLGFGGTFNEAGWDALQALSDADRERAIKLLFDETDGIGFTWGRIPIGASDYALSRYTLNENVDDFEMKKFSIERDKECLIKYIKAAQAVKPDLKFWASPWTPPTWMKKDAVSTDGFDAGEMRNEPKYLAANALYQAKFIEAYEAEGIPIYAIFPQNEPGYTEHYPTCGWGRYRKALPQTGSYQEVKGTPFLGTFAVDYLADTLSARGLKTQIWFGTLSNNNYANDYWNDAKNKDKNKKVIKALGIQWNNRPMVAGAAKDGYIVVQTEHQCGNYPWKNTKASSAESANEESFWPDYAPNNHNYGIESWKLIHGWIADGVHTYSAWNMVLDKGGFNLDQTRKWPQNALLAVDKTAKTLKVTPYYYVVRHIGQYVKPGARRLTTQGGDALAFKNPDGGIIVSIYNSNNAQSTKITISISGKRLQFDVPGQGWATLCLTPPVASKDSRSQFSDKRALRVTSNANGYKVTLPIRESGRVELLTVTGQVLESRDIPRNSREILLTNKVSQGLFLVRVVSDAGEVRSARFFNAR